MPDQTIFERTGFDKVTADQIAEQFRIDGWDAEIIEEDDGAFTVRATPPALKPTEAMVAGGVKGLLDFISIPESNGNYEAYYAHSDNVDNPRLTSKTLDQLAAFQKSYLAEQKQAGNAFLSSAMGRYQIMRDTLKTLRQRLNLTGAEIFDAAMQDRLATDLMERRGLKKYLANTITAEDFANELSKEWAGLPIVTNTFKDAKGRTNRKGFSYYADVNGNKSHVNPDAFVEVVRAVKT